MRLALVQPCDIDDVRARVGAAIRSASASHHVENAVVLTIQGLTIGIGCSLHSRLESRGVLFERDQMPNQSVEIEALNVLTI